MLVLEGMSLGTGFTSLTTLVSSDEIRQLYVVLLSSVETMHPVMLKTAVSGSGVQATTSCSAMSAYRQQYCHRDWLDTALESDLSYVLHWWDLFGTLLKSNPKALNLGLKYPLAAGLLSLIEDVDGRSNGKENNGSQTAVTVVTAEAESAEKGKQPSNYIPCSRVGKGQQREKDRGTARECRGNIGTDFQNEAAPPSESKGIDNTDKGGSDAQEEATLREKYEDLSRRYLSLVRGLVQAASDRKGDDCSGTGDEGADGKAQTEIVDKKLYDTIYLCKVAGILGAMKISDGPSNYVRAKRLGGVEDAYKRVMKDGFEFVEDLMKLGRPDQNSCGSVKAVFRDVHICVVKNIWE